MANLPIRIDHDIRAKARGEFIAEWTATMRPRPNSRALRELDALIASLMVGTIGGPDKSALDYELRRAWERADARAIAAGVSIESIPRTLLGLGDLPAHISDPVDVFRIFVGAVWPTALERWNRTRTFPLPGGLIHRAAIAFGRPGTGKRRTGGPAVEYREDAPGPRVVIMPRGEKVQLELAGTRVVAAARGEAGSLWDALAREVDPGTLRCFAAAIAAGYEDHAIGKSDVARLFYYSPTRFGRLLGFMPRSNGEGRADKIGDKQRKWIDRRIDALTTIGLRATVRHEGKELDISTPSLIHNMGEVEARSSRGRRKEVMLEIAPRLDHLWGSSAWFVPLTYDALAKPPDVDPRRWDDAFRLLLLLAVFGRATKSDRPIERYVARLAERLYPAADPRNARRSVREQLEVLASRGHVEYRIAGEGDEARVVYSLATSEIAPPMRALTAGQR